jgi:hypothetical protein
MNAVTLKAHYDGERIRLDEPFELAPDTKLLVLVVPDSAEAFREDWFALSRPALARACGDDEPDYSDLIPNPPAAT